ncbi:MAG TPA: type I glutamate--ammonia ligase [Candidatus Sulfotelmatobacter sp.]|jgi:glutamine synthetase|nr:type I glutamate--ammonia ligase [Candidatus Sulfotelmatobacter sp.]
MADPKTVLEFARKHDAKILDLRFTDIPGLWHHVSYPIEQLTEPSFEEGFGIDGSSIRAWAGIHESDMLLKPDANCHLLDPFTEVPTLVLICDVVDPVTKQAYDRDPRFIARKAEMYLSSSGIADAAYFGAEAEFFIFDNVRFDQRENYGFYYIDAEEGRWNSGREANNLGYRPRFREGYFPVAPTDHYQDLRSEMMLTMQSCGMEVECHHHEVASGGQTEIDVKFDSLLRSADKMLLYKYIVKNVANRNGKTVTFMPKPIFGDNGSGMHTHQSLWKGGEPLFAGDGYAGLSQLALWYIGGLIHHGPALSAIIAPTTNSYKRLVPGFEAPVSLAYSRRNRSAACRIPMYSAAPRAKRVEFRPPDPSCNPYMAFAAMLMAGLDGIENKIEPGQPLDKDIYETDPEEVSKIPSMPGSLEEALDALQRDHAFLLKGDVFTEELLRTYIEYKRSREVDAVRLRPHPYEFALYYDI